MTISYIWTLVAPLTNINSSMDDNHMPSKVWDEITNTLPNVNSCTVVDAPLTFEDG